MKGKRRNANLRLWAMLLAALMLLGACGGGSDSSAPSEMPKAEAAMEASDSAGEWDYDYGETAASEAAPAEASSSEPLSLAGAGTGGGADGGSSAIDLSQHKIIRRGEMGIRSEDYEGTLALIKKTVNESKGYIEDMQVEGTAPATAYDSGRYGALTLRVPANAFDSTLNALRQGGEVVYEAISSENVGARYRDTEAHIASLDTHLESLNNLMAKATELEDMLRLEEEISRLRYEKESLESSLRNWDDLVSYSTIAITLEEVNTLTPVVEDTAPEYKMSFGEEASYQFRSAWNGFVDGLRGFTLGILSAWPQLLVLLLLVLLFLFLTRRRRQRAKEERRKAKAEKTRRERPSFLPSRKEKDDKPEDDQDGQSF